MFQPIGKVIEQKSGPTRLSRSVQAAVILAQVNKNSQGTWQAVRFRNGRLTLQATSPIIAQELTLRRVGLLAQLQQQLGESIVKEIVITS